MRRKTALVDVWAKQYETFKPLEGAEIVDIRTGDRWITGPKGYAHITAEVGRRLSLVFNKKGFPSIQTACVTVPEEGLVGERRELTMQVPGMPLYNLLRFGIGKAKEGCHHVVTTVTRAGASLHDVPGEESKSIALRTLDGEPGATVSLWHKDGGGPVSLGEKPMYLGNVLALTEWVWPIATRRIARFVEEKAPVALAASGCLNDLASSLPPRTRERIREAAHMLRKVVRDLPHKATSGDGGVLFPNVPRGEYIIRAHKSGPDGRPLSFRDTHFKVFDMSPEVINLSPPHGPTVVIP